MNIHEALKRHSWLNHSLDQKELVAPQMEVSKRSRFSSRFEVQPTCNMFVSRKSASRFGAKKMPFRCERARGMDCFITELYKQKARVEEAMEIVSIQETKPL